MRHPAQVLEPLADPLRFTVPVSACKSGAMAAGLNCSQGGVEIPTGGMQASLRARELPPNEGC
jgi:hypothetical protein